jgi:lipoyl(octanoyl) transferase
MKRELTGIWLGRRRYDPVHRLQQELCARRQTGAVGDSVLLVEHEPVITLGRGSKPEHLLASPPLLEARGVELATAGRGGDVTLHAPGQLVCYPILDLAPDRRDVRRYVGDLAETMRRLALDFGVAAGTLPGLIGVWVDERAPGAWPGAEPHESLAKLGAIGVRISRWVTMHGFAFNLSTELELFDLIVPCGIRAHGVTSIARLRGEAPPVAAVAPRALELLAEVLDARVTGIEDHASRADLRL